MRDHSNAPIHTFLLKKLIILLAGSEERRKVHIHFYMQLDFPSEHGIAKTKFWKMKLKVAWQLLSFIVEFYTF